MPIKQNNPYMTLRSGKKIYYKYQSNKYIIKKKKKNMKLIKNIKDFDDYEPNWIEKTYHPIIILMSSIIIMLYAVSAFEMINYNDEYDGFDGFNLHFDDDETIYLI